MHLEQFNRPTAPMLSPRCAPAWTSSAGSTNSSDARPYPDLESLLAAGRRAADPFTAPEMAAALAHHPRIGERAPGTSTGARLSASEQAGLGNPDPAAAEALADGNRAYEEKFGQVFLIRAAGRSREEVLASLNARLAHTPEQEEPVIGQQLREIAVLRLEGLMNT